MGWGLIHNNRRINPKCLIPQNQESGIRLRAIVIGMVIALAICIVTPFNNAHRQATPLGGGHFPLAPFFVLVWLTVIVALLRKLFINIIL
jgi:hypothetical protein